MYHTSLILLFKCDPVYHSLQNEEGDRFETKRGPLTLLLGVSTDALVVFVEDDAHLLHQLDLLVVVGGQVDVGRDGRGEGSRGGSNGVGLAHFCECDVRKG